ncbi:MAG: autotransporter-associated beta strand repeat-containing protein [Candidatus Methylumidiphilus sp.]
MTLSGIIDDGAATYGITKTGAGTVVLTGNNTYGGGTTVSAGTLALGAGGSLAADNAVTVNSGATLDVANHATTLGSLAGGGSVHIGGTTLTVGGSGSTGFGGVISGTGGGLDKEGSGTLTLTGSNTYTGATTVNGGTLVLGSSNNISSGSALVVGSGGTVTVNEFAGGDVGSLSGSGAVNVSQYGFLSIGGNNSSSSFSGRLQGSGSFSKTGTGTLTLAGPQSISSIFVGNGTLDFQNSGSAPVTISSGVRNNSHLVFDNAGTVTMAGVVSGPGDLAKTGAGSLVLAKSAAFSSATVEQGTLQFGDGSTYLYNNFIRKPITTHANAGVVFSGTAGFMDNTFTGAGSLALKGTDMGILGLADHTGGTTLDAGSTLRIDSGANTGWLQGNVDDNGLLIFQRSDNVAFGDVISGSGRVMQASGYGGGTLTLGNANNTYTGGTYVFSGGLAVADAQALGAGAVDVEGYGSLKVQDGVNFGNAVNLLGGTLGGSGNATASGAVTLGNSLTVLNVNNTLNAAHATDTLTVAGAIGDNGQGISLTKTGDGTVVLANDNGYTGPTTVSGGTLQIGDGGVAGSVQGDIVDNAHLAFNRADAVDFAQTISGAGDVAQAGTGRLRLAGDNSYSGGSFVQAGVLAAGGNHALGTGTVTVDGGAALNVESGVTLANAIDLNGGTLSGSGAATAPVTVDHGDTLSPGNSPGTFTGVDFTFGAGGHYAFEVNDFLGAPGTGWDLLHLGGQLAITATAATPFIIDLASLDALNAPGFAPASAYQLLIAEAAGFSGFDAAAFAIDAAGFQNGVNGGSWGVSLNGNGLYLDFTPAANPNPNPTPEPGSFSLLALGLGFLAKRWRRAC